MTTIIFDTPTCDKPRILYKNLFLTEGATITPDDEDPDGDGSGLVENAFDWLTYTKWKVSNINPSPDVVLELPQSGTANTLFLHRYSVSNGNFTVEVDTSPDGISYTNVLSELVTSGTTRALYFNFDTASSLFWRVRFFGQAIGQEFAVIALGEDFEFERGPAPGFSSPFMSRDPLLLGASTRAGNPLPTIKREQGSSFSFQLDLVTDSWLRSIWHPFKEHAFTTAFAFYWNPDVYPEEIAYTFLENPTRGIPADTYDSNLTARIQLRGLRGQTE